MVTSGTVTSGTDIFFSKMSERSMDKIYFTVLASFDSRKISVMDRINDFPISYKDSENFGVKLGL